MVRPGGACAGQTERRCAVTGTGKSLPYPLAGDRAEATAFFARYSPRYRVASETGTPAGRQREAGQQAELSLALSAGVNGIYLSRASLDVAFDDSGRQINPLTARLTGNVAGVMKLFNRCGWQAEPESGASLPHQYSLMARQGVPGKSD